MIFHSAIKHFIKTLFLDSAPIVTTTRSGDQSVEKDQSLCPYCKKSFKKKGLGSHVKFCKLKIESTRRLSTSMPHSTPSNEDLAAKVSKEV